MTARLRADEWDWRYTGPGVVASGRLETVRVAVTEARPAATSLIVRISGQRNGVPIDSLQAAGTAIPGNAPYRVDNRLAPGEPRLSGAGFGFSLADGSSANPFFQAHTVPHGYREYFSRAPFVDGTLGPEDAENAIAFVVTPADGPTPWREVGLLAGLCVALGGLCRLRQRRQSI